MAKQSSLAKRMQAALDTNEQFVRELVGQFDADTVIITLSEEFGFGYDRQIRFLNRWTEIREEFAGALYPRRDPEADVKQEHLDARIRGIMDRAGKAEGFLPFRQRYPMLVDVSYKARGQR